MTQSTEQERAEVICTDQGINVAKDDVLIAFIPWEQAARRAQVVPVDDAIREVMRLIDDWSEKDFVAAEARLDPWSEHDPSAPVQMLEKLDKEANAARLAIEQKLRAMLAAAPQPPEAAPEVPQFSKVAKQKLDYLLEAGEEITGYAIQNKDGRRGAIDCHGFVYWWQDGAPVQMPEEDAGWFKYDRVSRCWHPQYSEYAETHAKLQGWQKLYTEHQVRQLLAAHGIK